MSTTLFMSEWEKIRGNFSEEEKTLLNGVIVGEVLCPRGAVLDAEKLPVELKRKLLSYLLTGTIKPKDKIVR